MANFKIKIICKKIILINIKKKIIFKLNKFKTILKITTNIIIKIFKKQNKILIFYFKILKRI